MNGGRPKYSTSFATGVRAYPLKNSHKSYTLNMVHGDCRKWAVYLLSYANVYMLIPALSSLYSCNLNLVMATYWLFESKHCGILYYQLLFMQLGHQVDSSKFDVGLRVGYCQVNITPDASRCGEVPQILDIAYAI